MHPTTPKRRLRRLAAAPLAAAALLAVGCHSAPSGAVSGASVGALAGIGLGSLDGNMGEGAAAGAIIGGIVGGILGDQNARAAERASWNSGRYVYSAPSVRTRSAAPACPPSPVRRSW